jgi:hypothetical protein
MKIFRNISDGQKLYMAKETNLQKMREIQHAKEDSGNKTNLTETILNNYNKNYRSTASTTDSHVNTSNK